MFAVQTTAKLDIYQQTRSTKLYELMNRQMFYLALFPTASKRSFKNGPFRLEHWLFCTLLAEPLIAKEAACFEVVKKVKSAYEPSGPLSRSISQFLWHEATRSISTPPLDGMPVHRRATPSINFAGTHLYTWVERGTVRVKCLAQEPGGHRASHICFEVANSKNRFYQFTSENKIIWFYQLGSAVA